jgi:aspartyl-tRNA(Asn)/glutamyl-tRNA(Gln) amidotransferase subunit B
VTQQTTVSATGYEIVIGLEIHVQLKTQSKMFCPCPTTFHAPPNTQTCPTCLGLPGSLPVLNGRAVELGLRTAVALDCRIHPQSRFHRKNYYYPDLPKNYQITQYEYKIHPPLATEGGVELPSEDGAPRRIRIRRVHLEEDTARLVHAESGAGHSLIDFNRAGVPLMEIVTEPDLRSPAEARIFLGRLRAILEAIDVSTGRMEEGSLRCDANLSLRISGGVLGIRTEVKNMNSLRSVERALAFEAARQQTLLDRGEPVVQETRHWDERRMVTFASRTKEEAQDYRYFPEPDLVPIALVEESIAQIRATLPELPEARRRRYIETYGLAAHEAALVTSSQAMAALFEDTVRRHPNPRAVSNWLVGDVSGYLNTEGRELEEVPFTAAHLAELLDLIDQGMISGRTAKEILPVMLDTGRMPREIVASQDLGQISDAAELAGVIDAVLAAHPGPAADYRAGKAAALTFLVGQIMKRTRGRANPETATRLLRERLRS